MRKWTLSRGYLPDSSIKRDSCASLPTKKIPEAYNRDFSILSIFDNEAAHAEAVVPQ